MPSTLSGTIGSPTIVGAQCRSSILRAAEPAELFAQHFAASADACAQRPTARRDSTSAVTPAVGRAVTTSVSPTAAVDRRDRPAVAADGLSPVNVLRSRRVSCGSSVFQICLAERAAGRRSIASCAEGQFDLRRWRLRSSAIGRARRLRRRGPLARPCSARLPANTTPSPRFTPCRAARRSTRCPRRDRARDPAARRAWRNSWPARASCDRSLEPAGRKAARKRQLHLLDVARRELDGLPGDRAIDRLPVVTRDVGHVFGRLQPAFDLERADAGRDQLGHQIVGRQILRAEQILLLAQIDLLAVAHQFVGQSAGLGHIARGWHCDRRAIRWSCTGPSRRRTARRARTLRAASWSAVAILLISSIDSSRASTTRSTPSSSATRIVSALVSVICVEA